MGQLSLRRWLGASHKVGQLMSYWILTVSVHVISCGTVQRLTNDEKSTDEWKRKMNEFDSKVKIRLNAKDTDLSNQVKDQPCWNRLSLNEDDEKFAIEYRHPIESTKEVEPFQLRTKRIQRQGTLQPIHMTGN